MGHLTSIFKEKQSKAAISWQRFGLKISLQPCKNISHNILMFVQINHGAIISQGTDRHRQRNTQHLHPWCTCLQICKTAAVLHRSLVWAKVRLLRDTEKHTPPQNTLLECKHTSWSESTKNPQLLTHTNINTSADYTHKHTHRERATQSLTHSFQSGNLEQTARHCRELELKTGAEKKKGNDCFLMLMDNTTLITALNGKQSSGTLSRPVPAWLKNTAQERNFIYCPSLFLRRCINIYFNNIY